MASRIHKKGFPQRKPFCFMKALLVDGNDGVAQ
jgi:hypothetical protein